MLVKIMKKIVMLFLFTFTLISCDFADNKLIVVNSSSDTIAFIIPGEPNYFPTKFGTDEIEDEKLNDSLLNTYAKYDPAKGSFGGVHFLAGDTLKNVWTFNVYWEQVVESTPTNTLKILFFADSIMTSGRYKWNEIYDRKLYLEQEYTLEELDQMNWKISFNKK